MTIERRAVLALVLHASGLTSFAAAAQISSDQPARIVVPYPAAGYYDRVARIMAEVLRVRLEHNFIVENRVGANGMIGADYVAKAPPDGKVLLLAGIGPNAISPALGNPAPPYDPVKDFTPIALLVSAPNVLVVPSTSPIKNLAELRAAAKSAKGRMNYAHNGIGSSVHLAMELLKGATGMDIKAIPYKGSSYAVTVVAAGEVDVSFGSVLDVLPLIRSGRLRALAVGGTQRITAIPKVPTVAESGVPGFDTSAWSGVMGPAGMPAPEVARLNKAINAALKEPATIKRLSPGGELQILGGTPEQFGRYVISEIAKWQKVVKDNGITPD